MTTQEGTVEHRHAVIGSNKLFWLYDSIKGFDLTHSPEPTSPPISPRLTIQTTQAPMIVDPAKSALVIIDMQNFFLAEALGRKKGAGHRALEHLVQQAIPAARKAGIRIIWLNWGLTQRDIDEAPPAMIRAFGFEVDVEANGEKLGVDRHGNPHPQGRDEKSEDGKVVRKWRGLGSSLGEVFDPIVSRNIDAGMMLMRDQWNTALYRPLDLIFEAGSKSQLRPDIWIHKNRMSGMWGAKTPCEEFLEREGIRTLFFGGVNTDQCVGGTLQDSYMKGYDCILLSDACGTTSPEYARQGIEFNASNVWGFSTTCVALLKGVQEMSK